MPLVVHFLPAILAGAAYVWIALRLGRREWPGVGACQGCGYDLAGLHPGASCPECGAISVAPARDKADSGRDFLALFAVLLLLPLPLLLGRPVYFATELLVSRTGIDDGTIIHFGWMLCSGPIVLAHCLAIEWCVRRILGRRRPRTPGTIVIGAILIFLGSQVVCGFVALMIGIAYMPEY